MKPKNERYTISVDFDGVIHSYTTPWINHHTIPDPPVPGAIEWLFYTIQKMDIVIHSMRCKTFRGRLAIKSYIKQHSGNIWYPSPDTIGLENIIVSHKKVASLVYLDDRAMRFEGTFPTIDEIHNAKPWYKK